MDKLNLVGDINGDGKEDLVAQTDSSTSIERDSLRHVFFINNNGSMVHNFAPDSEFKVEDLDENGIYEITLHDSGPSSVAGEAIVSNISFHRLKLQFWSRTTDHVFWHSLQVADLDAEGEKEIIVFQGPDGVKLFILSGVDRPRSYMGDPVL